MPIRIFVASFLIFCLPHVLWAEAAPEVRFQVVDNAYLVDSQTGLMWALQDNGSDIDWWEANSYCDNYSAGGYSDWRIPDIKELATLYTGDARNLEGYSIAGPIKLTDCCIWSSYDVLGGALTFSFISGKRIPSSFHESYQLRVLPVRGKSKIDLRQYKIY